MTTSSGYRRPGRLKAANRGHPASRDAKTHKSLPFACSLCGSCSDVCPVKIDLHTQLLAWRREIAVRGLLPWRKRLGMKFARVLLGNTWLFTTAGRIGRWIFPKLPRFMIYNGLNAWGKQRDLPPMPKQSFRELYRQRKRP